MRTVRYLAASRSNVDYVGTAYILFRVVYLEFSERRENKNQEKICHFCTDGGKNSESMV